MKAILGFVLLLQSIHLSASACVFPTDFVNTWQTNTRGTWTVNTTTISNFPAQVVTSGSSLFNMDCHEQYTGYYVIKSQEVFEPFGNGAQYNMYTCLYLEKVSSVKFVYSLLTSEFFVTPTVTERVTVGGVSASLSGGSVCSDTAYTTAGERIHVALVNGSESSGKSTCPSIIQAHYTYLGTTCNSTAVNVCSDTSQIVYNTTACSENSAFSQNGTLDCVYDQTINDYTYVTLYNEDSTTDGSTYYPFSCMVISQSGVYVYASVRPTECEANQVPTTTPSGGYVTVFEQTSACTTTTTTEEDLTYLYIIIGVIAFLVIIAIIILIICCIKRRSRRQKDVESADDESDQDSEESKSQDGECKPEEDDSKPPEGDDQQQEVQEDTQEKTSDEEKDKQSIDSGFIPDEKKEEDTVVVIPGEEREDDDSEKAEEEEEDETKNVAQEDGVHQEPAQEVEQRQETEPDVTQHENEKDNSGSYTELQNEKIDQSSQNEQTVEPDSDHISRDGQQMETEADTGSQGDADTGSQGNADTGSQGDADTGSQGNADTGSQGDADTGSQGNADTGSQGHADTGSQGNADTGSRGDHDPESDNEDNVESDTDTKTQEENMEMELDYKQQDDQTVEMEADTNSEDKEETVPPLTSHNEQDEASQGSKTELEQNQVIQDEHRTSEDKEDPAPPVIFHNEQDEASQGSKTELEQNQVIQDGHRIFEDKEETEPPLQSHNQQDDASQGSKMELEQNRVIQEEHMTSEDKEETEPPVTSHNQQNEASQGSQMELEQNQVIQEEHTTDKDKEKDEDTKDVIKDGEADEDSDEDEQKDEQKSDAESGTTEDEGVDEGQRRKKKARGDAGVVLEGQLSKVLVTRDMEEKVRDKRSGRKTKTRGVRRFAAKKSKKYNAVDDNPENEMDEPDMADVDISRFPQPVAAFMTQYHTKKDIEKRLDEAHYWDLPEDDNIVLQIDQIEEELEKEERKAMERMDADVEIINLEDTQQTEDRHKTRTDGNTVGDGTVGIKKEEENTTKMDGQEMEGSGCSSEDDSPESKKVRTDYDSDLDSDVFERDDDCLPDGYVRNNEGHIVRKADGKICIAEKFQKLMKKARLKRLFNIPRLKRNKKGRPTGGMKDDTFGPDIQTSEQKDNNDNERVDRHLSEGTQKSSEERKGLNESRRRSKMVAFSVGKDHYDKDGNLVVPHEDKLQPRVDSSTTHSRKLRNRLFRKKTRRAVEDLPPILNGYGGHGQFINVLGVDSDKPRELNSVVTVYGQPAGTITSSAPRSTLPPIGFTRTNTFDRNQLQNFREGLSKDKQILEKGFGVTPLPQKRTIRRISVEELSVEDSNEDEDMKSRNVEIGDEDEFFLVGGQNEPLFTRVRPPPDDLARSLLTSHDRRHAIPWSIRNAPTRPHTDGHSLSKSLDAPRSDETYKRDDVDDRRLRELLEELYKDKKYFDHVIDTTEPTNNADIDDRDLAEHGRNYLLDRADFWEDRGPLPARPPRTSLGMRLTRMQTMSDSGRVSMTSTTTCTPPITELPNQMPLRQEQTFS